MNKNGRQKVTVAVAGQNGSSCFNDDGGNGSAFGQRSDDNVDSNSNGANDDIDDTNDEEAGGVISP